MLPFSFKIGFQTPRSLCHNSDTVVLDKLLGVLLGAFNGDGERAGGALSDPLTSSKLFEGEHELIAAGALEEEAHDVVLLPGAELHLVEGDGVVVVVSTTHDNLQLYLVCIETRSKSNE